MCCFVCLEICYQDNFDHSHQTTQSEKMLIIATRRNGIGKSGNISIPSDGLSYRFIKTIVIRSKGSLQLTVQTIGNFANCSS